jgi:hypothetical protein
MDIAFLGIAALGKERMVPGSTSYSMGAEPVDCFASSFANLVPSETSAAFA